MVKNVDGEPKPIGPDDRPKKLKVGAVVVTLGLGVTLAFATSAGIGGGSGAADPGVSVSESASVSVRSARTSRQKSDRTRARLSLRHPNVRATGEATSNDCAGHATGRVQAFLVEHPCRALQRGTFSVSPSRAGRVVVVLAWVEMAADEQAAELKRLLDEPGSGTITPLDRRVTLTGQHYRSNIDGNLVTTAEAVPVATSVPVRLLDEIARQGAD